MGVAATKKGGRLRARPAWQSKRKLRFVRRNHRDAERVGARPTCHRASARRVRKLICQRIPVITSPQVFVVLGERKLHGIGRAAE